MQIKESIAAWRNRGELIREEIVGEAEKLTRLIQPYTDELVPSKYWSDIIRGENPIGDTRFCGITLVEEGEKLVCCFLQSDGSGFETGDLQVTMACERQPDRTKLLSFETIEVFKLPHKKEKYWLPLKPANQLKNLKLANECLGIVKTFRSGTE